MKNDNKYYDFNFTNFVINFMRIELQHMNYILYDEKIIVQRNNHIFRNTFNGRTIIENFNYIDLH